MFFSRSKDKELELWRQERQRQDERFLEECRQYVDKINNSQAVKKIAQEIKEHGGCTEFTVYESGIGCGKFYFSFCDLGLKNLSTDRIKNPNHIGGQRKDAQVALDKMRTQNKEIAGLYFQDTLDVNYQFYEIRLNECAVVGRAVASLLWDSYTYSWDFGSAKFKDQRYIKKVSDWE